MVFVMLTAFCWLFFLPYWVSAMGAMADAMCTPVILDCGCGQIRIKGQCVTLGPQVNKWNCPNICWDETSGFNTYGTCVLSNKCEGKSTSGPNGFGLDQVAKILGDLMGQLMKGSQNGSAQTQPQTQTQTTGYGANTGCSSYTPTSDQTLAASNQCYYYVSSGSSSGGYGSTGTSVSDQLLQALGGSTSGSSNSSNTSSGSTGTGTGDNTGANTNTNTNTNPNVSDILSQIYGGTPVTTAGATSSASSSRSIFSITQAVANPANQANLAPGISGDVQLLNNGGTVVASSRDTGSNSAVAGFYGSDTFNGQPQGVVAGLCKSRPWASNFLSYIIPPSFFDSLCALRGYAVGNSHSASAPSVTVTQTAPKPIAKTPTSTPATAIAAPKVDIWASPMTVPLGSRTSIFWNTQGVTNCTETSPDGNFSQSTLSGGASTAPITGATTFTISCITPDGEHVTDNVTVNLSI